MLTRRRAIACLLAAAETPSVVWKRALGEGHSGIAVADNTLYTMYRKGSREAVVALDALTGSSVWERDWDAPFRPDNPEARHGPHCTPVVAGTLVVTAGVTGLIHAHDRLKGSLVWQRDLRREFHATEMGYGYSSHPLVYRDSVIVMAGGHGAAMLRLRLQDGAVVWKGLEFKNSNSSPVLIDVDGQQQVVAYAAAHVMGVSPETGELLWAQENLVQHGLPVVAPVWCPGNRLFLTSAYEGCRVLELRQSGGRTAMRQLWAHDRARNYFQNVLVRRDHVLFASGVGGPAFLTAVEVRSGRVLWRSRDIGRAQLAMQGERLLALEESGTLRVARIEENGVAVSGSTALLRAPARTPPAVDGTRVYLRDHASVMALQI